MISVVPGGIYDAKVMEDVEKLKVRYIDHDRRISLFAGFSENQKNTLLQREIDYKTENPITASS